MPLLDRQTQSPTPHSSDEVDSRAEPANKKRKCKCPVNECWLQQNVLCVSMKDVSACDAEGQTFAKVGQREGTRYAFSFRAASGVIVCPLNYAGVAVKLGTL